MLPLEKKFKTRRGDECHFVHKGDTFPNGSRRASCEKHIPKPAPNGTKFVPWHVDAAP